jgi:hypothetical protein
MTTARRTRLRVALLVATALGGLGQAAPAAAQSQDEAAARALFNAARKLMKDGHVEEACAKFEAARHLYPSPGVLLNLADCHERLNRTASAWTEFGDSADAAARENRPGDQAEAQRRQLALQDKLSLLAVRVEVPAPDEIVERDGAPVDRATWNTGIPVDPGSHVVTAKAGGRAPWSTTVEVKEPGKTVTVVVPALEPIRSAAGAGEAPSGAAATPGGGGGGTVTSPGSQGGVAPPLVPPGGDEGTGNGQRIAGWVVGGVGVATMATGGVLGLVAKSQFNSAESESGNTRHADSVNAGKLADTATVLWIVGGVATAAGIVVWLTAPKAPAHVSVGASGPAVFVRGEF